MNIELDPADRSTMEILRGFDLGWSTDEAMVYPLSGTLSLRRMRSSLGKLLDKYTEDNNNDGKRALSTVLIYVGMIPSERVGE